MRRHLALLLALLALAIPAAPANAADSTVPAMTAGGAISDTDLMYCAQSAGTLDRKCTPLQLSTYIFGKVSGDLTCVAGGACTLKNTGTAAGPIGSTTTTPVITTDAQGRVTALTSAAIALPAAAIPTATAGPAAVNGVATTFMRSDAAPAIQKGTAAVFGIVEADGTTITSAAGVLTAVASGTGITSLIPGGGQVSSTAAACSQGTISTGGQTLSTAECVNAQVGATYAIVDGDRGKLITGTNAAAQAYSIAQAGATTTFQSGWFARLRNSGTGAITVTPTTSTINGAASYVVMPGWTIKITSDGTNYQVDAGSTGVVAVNSQTGVNYAFALSDFAKLVNLSNAANQVPTIPQATGTFATWYVGVCNQGAGTQTLTPTTSTIGGAASFVLPAGSAAFPKCVGIYSDGTNYQISPEFPNFGANVATAAALALSAAGGLTSTIASGTAVLGTSAIASGACATVVTAAATNALTTDVLAASYNSDPTAVTGYGASATGAVVTVYPYPTAGNANFKVCNSTASSITPGAMTLNWRVAR